MALGAKLTEVGDLSREPWHARVAIVFDWENWWAISGPDHPAEIDYLGEVKKWHRALHELQVDVDFVHPDGNLHHYDAVFVPQLYLLADSAAANLSEYVAEGGQLFVGAFTDVVDPSDSFRLGFMQQLGPLLGIRFEDFGALDLEASTPGSETTAPASSPAGKIIGRVLASRIHPTNCTVLGRFAEGRNSGWPALTELATGRGRAIFLATIVDVEDAKRLIPILVSDVRLDVPADSKIEIIRRPDFTLYLNHSIRAREIRAVDESDERIAVPPQTAVIVREDITDAS